MLGICWDDMDLIPLSKFIYDAGVVIKPNAQIKLEPWMNHIRVPAATYVVINFEGDIGDEEDALDYLWHSWFPRNNCVPAYSPTLEVFMNERSLCDWANLKLKLCIPITAQTFL